MSTCFYKRFSRGSSMSKSFGKSRGQVAVLYTGIIAVLLGAAALGSDVAVMYVNWQQLQKAADAAVLVGGAGLPDNIPGATAATNAYLASNGVVAPDIVTGPTVSNNNTEISVTVRRTVPYNFGRALGMLSADVQVTATAQAQTSSSPDGNIFPAGLDAAKFPNLKFDGSVDYSIYSTGNDAPGNKGPVDINQDGDPWPYMGLTPFTGTLTDGETIPSITGCKVGHASTPLSERIAAGVAMDPNGTWNNHSVGNPQEVVIPVGTWSGNGSNATFTISSFVKAWITPDSSACNVNVFLMPGVAGGKSSLGTPCTGNTICVVALVQ
jgi:Flp pilus assembly protein TadG